MINKIIQDKMRKILPLFVKNRIKVVYYFVYYFFKYNKEQRNLIKIYQADYGNIQLMKESEFSVNVVKRAAMEVYGDKWNMRSDALRREVVKGFEEAIQLIKTKFGYFSYLEVGSNQGLSLSIILTICKKLGLNIKKTLSIDPYFESGYDEFSSPLIGAKLHLDINKSTRDGAFALYDKLDINVNLIEDISDNGLIDLIRKNQCFNCIYIDGSHEKLTPMTDITLSLFLLEPNGVIILDDHHWPDIKPIKELCDKHLEKIYESWKIAVYTKSDSIIAQKIKNENKSRLIF